MQKNRLSNLSVSAISKGRYNLEKKSNFRTSYQRDRDRIIHSTAFRRLKHKTQVFINPDGDHFITRMTHTLNVTQIGRSIAKTLGLNPDLTEAICLGHDVGHSPFGHTGEDVLNEMLDGGWSHSENSVRMLSVIEPLNLTKETINGIEKHPWRYKEPPFSPEGLICRFADRIAYLSHDVEDAIRAGVLRESEIPKSITSVLGSPGKTWINSLISGVFKASSGGSLQMDDEILKVMHELREFMFDKVYLREETLAQRSEAKNIVEALVVFYEKNPDKLPENYVQNQRDIANSVDYVAGMTDRFAISTYNSIH